jgi:putative ABC transport system ATP-binding protein
MIPRLHADKIKVIAPGREETILSETTLKIYKNEFVVLLGHNGSGKSTLIKALSGDIKPNSGYLLVDGTEMINISKQKKAQDIVVLTQKAEDRLFLELTLEENIILWESRYPANEQLQFEEIILLTNTPERFLSLGKQRMSNFSGGEKQSILLSLALAHAPKLLFLDEHTASLDYKASHEVMSITNKAVIGNKSTAIMVTHNLEDAVNYGNRIIIMREGKLIIDLKKSANLSKNELKEMMSYNG